MDLTELVRGLRVVELAAKTRPTAVRALVQAIDLDDRRIALDDVLEAIEEREATAQTVVDRGFAMPHAVIPWKGDWRLVLGRSREGVDYGIAEVGRVHLIALFVIGEASRKQFHLALLAAVAELLSSSEFRKALVAARDSRAVEQLLRERVGLSPDTRSRRARGVPRINTILVRKAIDLVEAVSAQALLVAIDKTDHVPWEPLNQWQGRCLVVTATPSEELALERPDTHLLDVPHTSLARMDRAKLGLLLAASRGLLGGDSGIVCVTGSGARHLDSITLMRPEAQLELMFGGRPARSAGVKPAVILRVLSLAVEIAAEGREGRSLGTVFVVGDSRQVMRHAQQLVLNPFHGYSHSLRSVLDPSLTETIKEFSQIDGAFIVQSDGKVLSAGTYLVPRAASSRLPGGLGTRHRAAAAITAQTKSLAVVVSQSTGAVTVFRKGQILLELVRASATR